MVLKGENYRWFTILYDVMEIFLRLHGTDYKTRKN